jgi:hypothetical protein
MIVETEETVSHPYCAAPGVEEKQKQVQAETILNNNRVAPEEGRRCT